MVDLIYYTVRKGRIVYLYGWHRCSNCELVVRANKVTCCVGCSTGKKHSHTIHYKLKGSKIKGIDDVVNKSLESFMK